MEAGGRLIAATARGDGDKLDQILITIADDGGGIAEERLPYVFDPFFSTKDTGTGLGLPISLSIIENHRGHFRIVSRPGEGTTVIIEMPMA
jgi:signal transduction histidine kinase